VTSPNASAGDGGSTDPPALRLVAIDKSYGALRAVHDAELEIRCGSLHAVVGENGAGKSTLLKVGAGIVRPDAGQIWSFGVREVAYDARRAQALGIAMVQQHFALFEELTALENIIIGHEPVRAWRAVGGIDVAMATERVLAVLQELGVQLPLHAKVATLGVGDKQRLEIARALYRDARIIILDEPTAVLTPLEATALYATLRRLVGDGRGVVVVTHKLDEVETHADVVTVMRRGTTLATRPVRHGEEVARLGGELVGGEPLPELRPRPPLQAHEAGGVRLRISELTCGRGLRGVSLEVYAGEIVGIAGVLGNGQSELIRILGGLLEADGGELVTGTLEVVHEDRQTTGLVLDASVEENLVHGQLARFSRWGLVDDARVHAEAMARIERFDVRPRTPETPARALSGGNQQKVVIARALARDPAVLVIAHPTRGVDLVAARSLHEQIFAAAARGTAVLVIGADLTELRLLCGRILVMLRGRIVATLPPSADDATLGAAMLGRDAGASN